MYFSLANYFSCSWSSLSFCCLCENFFYFARQLILANFQLSKSSKALLKGNKGIISYLTLYLLMYFHTYLLTSQIVRYDLLTFITWLSPFAKLHNSKKTNFFHFSGFFQVNPIPTGHGRNQPIYERHVTKSGRNRVKNTLET